MEKFKIKFSPDNKTVEVANDSTILAAATSAGLYINSACGGDGVCGKCKVIVRKGKVISQPSGSITLEEKRQHIYLACLTTVHSDLEVEIPAESRQDFQNLTAAEIDARLKGLYTKSEDIESALDVSAKEAFNYSPLSRKIYLELHKPNLQDNISDLDRLYQGIESTGKLKIMQTGLANIKQLGELLRDSDWKVTVTLGNRDGVIEIMAIEPLDTSKRNFGLCFDIGTTTISGQLVDLNSQEVMGTKATYNKQAHFGSDVITRIIYAQEEDGLDKLHKAVTETMNQMIQEFIKEHNIDLNDLTSILCAGNTTMMHLLLSIDPTYIRKEPYVPTVNFVPTIRSSEAGIHINPRALLSCIPGVASYVGGDTTAGVLSSGLYKEEELSLLIDIGTNGEIVLGNKDFLAACAASAGPAFEGSGVSCGMRASNGAIQKVRINKADFKVTYDTIAGSKPRGICGSGYIDLIAEMLGAGIIDKGGKIVPGDPKRIRKGQEGKEFIVVPAADADAGADIVITEADIENLKRAKAAIYSASALLTRRMNFEFSQLVKIFIAGGFGTYLDIESAIRIGLLPDLERSKFAFIGNSSLAGARQALLSYEARKKADEIARSMACIELSNEPAYMDEYMAALFFPHTDLTRFPSVKA